MCSPPAPSTLTARAVPSHARTAPCPRRAPPTHPYHSPASPRVPVAHPAALTHLPAVPIAPAAHCPPSFARHAHIARAVATGLHPHPPSFAPPFLPRSLCAPHICTARARRAARRSPRHARSFTRRAIRLHAEILELQTFSFLQSILNFVVSLPNASEKDVKGLLFRK